MKFTLVFLAILPVSLALKFNWNDFFAPKPSNVICPDRKSATGTCNVFRGCKEDEYCYQSKGCCKIPMCSDDRIPSKPCTSKRDCSSEEVCVDGGCCPMESEVQPGNSTICPYNTPSSNECYDSFDCGINEFCSPKKICCRLPACPSGKIGRQPCGEGSNLRCQPGYTCYRNRCCSPLDMMSGNREATTPEHDYETTKKPMGYRWTTSANRNVGTTKNREWPVTTTVSGLRPEIREYYKCPDNSFASRLCHITLKCPDGELCYKGGCCKKLMCPNGETGRFFCDEMSSCIVGYTCIDGACCRMLNEVRPTGGSMFGQHADDRCPDGTAIRGECNKAGWCPNWLEYCYEDKGCCKRPMCPNGQTAWARPGKNNTCPPTFEYYKGGCCPIGRIVNPHPKPEVKITCPFATASSGKCYDSWDCKEDEMCYQSKTCCHLPVCPNGEVGAQPCGFMSNMRCSPSHECIANRCCRKQSFAEREQLPFCPNGQLASNFCSANSSCSSSEVCFKGGCCSRDSLFLVHGKMETVKKPMTGDPAEATNVTCPNLKKAYKKCSHYTDCNLGDYCYEEKACCPIPLCPNQRTGMLMCDENDQCPPTFKCVSKSCCPHHY